MNLTVEERVNRILEYYFSGRLPADLEAEILSWIMEKGHDEEKDAKLEEIWNRSVRYEERPANEKELVRSINAVKRELGLPLMEIPADKAAKRRYGLGRKVLRYAAVAAIPIMLIGAGYFWLTRDSGETEPKAMISELSAAAAEVQESISLPDGSKVWLKPGSILFYPERFEDKRVVRLEGEAYFKVEKDTDNPFIVETKMISVTVLGTEFSVRANSFEDETEIVLNTGALKVDTRESSLLMGKRERVLYRHGDNTVIKEELATGESADVRAFSFENEPLEDVLAALARRYNINIKYSPSSIDGESVTMKLNGDEPLDSLLTWLRDITGAFDYRIDGEEVVVK